MKWHVRYPPLTLRLECHNDAAWFIAVEEGKRLDIVGWSRLERDENGRVWFSVRSYFPRRGVGRACLAAACAWADKNKTTVHLTSKPELVDWYASAGFVQCAAWDGFTCAEGQVLMERLPMS